MRLVFPLVSGSSCNRVALAAALALAVTGCPKKTDAVPDAQADAAVVASVDAGPEATNETDVTRYPDETELDHVSATVLTARAVLLKSTPKGATIATLKKGDTVLQLGEHNGFFRVLAADPKDASKKVMGWVVKFAFDEPPVHKKAPLPKCIGEGILLVSDKANPLSPRCAKECAEDNECPGSECTSAIVLDDKNGVPAIINGDTHSMGACAATKAHATKPAGLTAPTCKPDEVIASDDEKGPLFCNINSACNFGPKDCASGGKCASLHIFGADGKPVMMGPNPSDYIVRNLCKGGK